VAVVIVFSFGQGLVGRTSTLSGFTMATPEETADDARQAASGYALRALPRIKDLHHFPGHKLSGLSKTRLLTSLYFLSESALTQSESKHHHRKRPQ